MTDWQKQRSEQSIRLDSGSRYASGKMVSPESTKALVDAAKVDRSLREIGHDTAESPP